jgi:hypothetical protein
MVRGISPWWLCNDPLCTKKMAAGEVTSSLLNLSLAILNIESVPIEQQVMPNE